MDKGIFALVAFVCGFSIAQLWKFFSGIITHRGEPETRNFKAWIGYLMRSGGMPSGHSASMAGVATYLGCLYGFSSGIFALAVAITLIVLYDAMHVRYAVGEQGEALNEILIEKHKKPLARENGHTLAEVVVGVLLGIALGVGCYLLLGR